MKVSNIRCHVGAQIGAKVYTSLDSKVNKCQMTYSKEGVFILGSIDGIKIAPHLIPLSTIASIRFDQEEFDQNLLEQTKEPAKKPGRPAKEQQPAQ